MLATEDMLTVDEIQLLGEELSLYEPLNDVQSSFHISNKSFRWFFGGNQSGKTHTNMMDLAMVLLGVHPTRSTKSPGLWWACVESWEQVRDILWEDNLKKFIPADRIVNIQYGQDHVPKKLWMDNGNRAEFKAFNQGRRLFQGRAIDGCYCDEQCQYDFQGIFNEIQARLLARSGYTAWSMTPIIPQLFLEERIEDLPDTDEMFFADLNANRKSIGGYIEDNRVDELINDWPEEVQATRVRGRFASFYGAVFKTYSRNLHVIKPFKIPEEWRKYRGFDFGFTNPFVCLWAAQDEDDNWYIYREYYKAKTCIGEHIEAVHQMSRREKYIASIADPENAENRSEMRKARIATLTARKDIAKGIEVVQSKLKVKPNGKPSLFIFNTCRNTCREMALYQYPRGTNLKNPKDVPLQVNDHTVDSLRYILYTIEKPKMRGRVCAA